MSDPQTLGVATALFVAAIVHTFLAQRVHRFAHHFPEDSVRGALLRFLGEVEVVFGLWAALLLLYLSAVNRTPAAAVNYLESVNFTEAVFVFVIMCMAATRPIVQVASQGITRIARLIPLPAKSAFFISTLVLGPLLGSFITEPAAMTLCALILRNEFFTVQAPARFKYATLALLFVNVSIGGTLTHFAAPPVLMVAGPWGWDTAHMLGAFGWKAAIAILVNTIAAAILFRAELAKASDQRKEPAVAAPWWICASHIAFLALCVAYHAHMAFFVPLFLLFLGWTEATKRYQSPLKIRESLLVGFFLGGLVVLGGMQGWWLKPLLESLSHLQLFIGATALTAVTDNAALTFLGTLVPNLPEEAKYALVAGAVSGGGLTVIANAPNPAGYALLSHAFGEAGISPIKLFAAALPPTLVAMACFMFL